MTSLAELAHRLPHETAVECGETRLTWASLDLRTAQFAHGLKALGLRPGDHVAIMVSNRVEFLEATIGAWRAGCSYTPIKTGWTATEIGFVLDLARSRVMVTDRDAGREAARNSGLHIIDVDRGYEPWLSQQDGSPTPDTWCGWKLPFTSGTTGRPKAVVMSTAGVGTFSQSWSATAAYADLLGLPGRGVHLFLSRLFNGAPLTFGLAALARGATLRILPSWDAGAALSALTEPDVTSTIAVPTMFRQFVALGDHPGRRKGEALETILHGGEPCPAALKRTMIEWFGPVLTEYYGFTEGGMTVASAVDWLERPGTVGLPMPGLTVEILDFDGKAVSAGQIGRINFVPTDGKQKFSYLDDPLETEAAHTGCAFTVGDFGWLDPDGYLYVSGRSEDLILVGGVNVYPAEIEDALSAVEGVDDIGAVGVPDSINGERVVLVVAMQVGEREETVRERLGLKAQSVLAPYKRPSEIVIASSLPRDETGKLLRNRLHGLLCAGNE